MATTPAKRETNLPRHWYDRGPLSTLRDELDSVLTQFFGEGHELFPMKDIVPEMDVSETDTAVEVRMDLPGYKPEDVDIRVSHDMLTISGTRTEEHKEDKGNGRTWHRTERRTGSFTRSVRLPSPVKDADVEAAYRDGVLTVTLPKTKEARTRKVPIKG